MTHRRGDQASAATTRCASGRSSSTAPSPRGPCPSRELLPREALLALADRVRRWHEAQRPADISLEVEPGVTARAPLGAARHGRDLRAAQPRLDARHVRRPGAGGGRASGSSSARRPPGAGLVAAAAELLGIDEVWALGGPQAIGWLAYVEQVDKIVGPGNAVRERGEARGLARRRRSTCRAGRPRWSSLARGESTRGSSSSSSPRRREHGPDARLPRRRRRSRRPRRSRPSTSCCSATPRRSPTRCATPARSSSGRGRRSPAGDYATGGNHVLPTSGWARSVGGLGLETFLKPVTTQRLTRGGARARSARRSRRSPRPRACPRTPRRCGDEGARARVQAPTPGRRRPTRSRGSPGSTRRRSCASTRTRRRCRCPRRGPGRSPARSRAISGYPAGGYRAAARRDRRLQRRRARERRARRGRRRPDPALRARLRRPGRHDRDPGRADVSALPHRRAARGRRGRRRRPGRSPSPAGRTTRPASSARSPRPGRSSSTRRTSSTAARPRCRCSTTA